MSKKSRAPLTRGPENRPSRTTLCVPVSAETAAAAARLARDYAGRKLETVLAAFVADLAVAAARPGAWEHERVSAWLASHGWACEPKELTPCPGKSPRRKSRR